MNKIEGIIFDWKETLFDKSNNRVFPFSGKVLQYLSQKGYKIGLISLAKKAGYTPEEIIKHRDAEIIESGLRNYFDCIIIDIGKNPGQFIECMQKLGVRPEKTLVVDDRTVRGIKIGNNLGCQTAWIQKGEYSNESPNEQTGEPTYRINSVEDLLTIL